MKSYNYYIVRDKNGTIIDGDENIARAVLSAAQHDGYGAEFARNSDGQMVIYRGNRHIGNNTYRRNDSDEVIMPYSSLTDDDAAEDELAKALWKKGNLHVRFDMAIQELTYEDGTLATKWKPVLTHVDGQPIAEYHRDIHGDDPDVTIQDTLNMFEY